MGTPAQYCMVRWTVRVAVGLGLLAPTAQAAFTSGLISADFQGGGDLTQIGAALFGEPGDLWNPVEWPASPPASAALFSTSGAASDVRLLIPNIGAFGVFQSQGPFGALLKDGFQSNGPAATFTLSGLTPHAAYDLAVYSIESGLPADTAFTVAGTTRHVVSDGVSFASLMRGVNYESFTAQADAAGQLNILVSGGGAAGFDFNGLQIRPAAGGVLSVPLPAALWGGILGCAAACNAAKRFRRAC